MREDPPAPEGGADPPRRDEEITSTGEVVVANLQLLATLPVGVLLPAVLVAALLVAISAASLPRDMTTLVRFAVSEPCADDALGSDCVLQLPGTISSRRDVARAVDGQSTRHIAVVHVHVPDVPDDARLFQGRVVLQLPPSRADRAELRTAADVEVSFFAGRPIEVTGPGGTARVEDGPVTRFAGIFGLTVGLAGVTLIGAAALRQRLRHGAAAPQDVPDLPRWSVAAGIGLVVAGIVGGLLGWLAGRFLGPGWAVPVTLLIAVLAGGATTISSWRVASRSQP